MKKAFVTLALCAAGAGPALAQNWYGTVDIGTLNMRNTIYADPGSVTVSGGYRFSPNLGAEAGVTAIGDTTFTNNNGSRTARQGDLRLLAVGFLPINPNFEFFGKAGLGLHTARVRGTGTYDGTTGPHTTTNVIVGAGIQLNFNQRFGMRIQYEHLGKAKSSENDSGADISRVSVGGVLNF
jgi:hypothetical protein